MMAHVCRAIGLRPFQKSRRCNFSVPITSF
jgi:hypothetical protein